MHNTFGQTVNLPCQTEAEAFIGLDRNNWNGNSTDAHSEGVMHNFDLPNNTFGDCKKIVNIEIDITINSVDDSGLPGDCSLFDYFINFSDNCPDFAPASCNFIFNQIQGFPVTQTVNFTCPPIDFAFGETFGIDIVPAMNNTGCSVGQSTIASGSIVLDYQLCVTVTIDDLTIDTPPDLGDDQTICSTETTLLDPGIYTSYQWDPNGETSPTIDVGPGNYTVTVTDINGCTDTDEINILQFPDSGITFDPGAPAVCDDGIVSVSVNENYSAYDWSNFMSGQTVTLTTGNYDVTITDNNNCTSVNSVVVTNVDPPNAGIDNFLPVCDDGTTYNLDELLVVHDVGGNWTDDDASGVDVNTNPLAVDFTGTLPGTYDYTYTVPGIVPCPSDQATITVEVFEQNNAGVSEVVQYCTDPGNLDFILLLSNPDPGGVWSDPDGAGVNLDNPLAVNFNGIPEGTYDFEYLLPDNGTCPEQSAILTITIIESADAGFNNSITVCDGTQFDLTNLINGANGSGIFEDTGGSGALTGSIVNTTGLGGQSFIFSFIVGSMSSPCGEDQAIYTFNIESSLFAGDDVSAAYCSGVDDIDLFDLLTNEDSGGSFFDVNSSGGLTNNILVTSGITPGTYVFEYQVGDGLTCPQDEAEITLTFFEDPAYDFPQTEIFICNESCEDIQINFTGVPPFSFPIEVYSITTGDLIASNNITTDSSTYIITTCNSQGTNEFVNDTLNLISDSTWIVTIPMINDINCSIDSVNNSDTLVINTISNSFYQLDTTACITDTVVINGVMLFDGNATYLDTISGINCDSIINISVNFLDIDTIMIDTTICSGDSVFIAGFWFDESNSNLEIDIMNSDGCDSLIAVTVSFFPLADSLFSPMLCVGDSVIVNGEVYNISNSTGTEILVGQASSGCDSIVDVSIQFSNDIMLSINDTICLDGFVEVGGEIFDMNMPTGQVLLPGLVCDTLVDVDLMFYDSADSILSGIFCPDFSVVVNGTLYDINNASGSEILIDSSQFGCDSIVNIDLEYFMPVISDFNESICDNDSMIINGTVYNNVLSTGVETFTGANGCDSIVNIQLTILQTYSDTDSITICAGDSVFLANDWQFVAGTYIDNFRSEDMCDSIITIELMVISCDVNVILIASNNECALDSNGSISLNNLSDNTIPFTIVWEGTSNGIGGSQVMDTNQNTFTISNLISDNYNISILNSDGTTIYQGSTTVIDINPLIEGNWVIIDSILCFGDHGSLEFQAIGGLSPYNYNWNSTNIGNTQLAQDINAGEYSLTVTDQVGCTFDTSFMITEPATFMATISTIDPSCLGASDGNISISEITGGLAPYMVTVNDEILDVFALSNLDTGIYIIDITDANECLINFTEELTATNNSNFGTYSELHQIIEGDSVTLEGTVIDSNFTFEWVVDTEGNLSCIDCPNPTANPSITTTYALTISDSLGCSQSLSILVEVTQKEIVNIFPNVFSPNGDNSNDELIFKVNNGQVIALTMNIYDRWGNLVYVNQSMENEISWDGTKNGSVLDIGVYVYRTIIQFEGGSSEVVIGDVLLIE